MRLRNQFWRFLFALSRISALAGAYLAIASLLPAGAGPLERTILIIRMLGGAALILTSGFGIAGVMGLAREGPKGPYFFVEQAFYVSTMAYPVIYLAGTGLSVLLADRSCLISSLLAQAAPIAIPVVLFFLARATGRKSQICPTKPPFRLALTATVEIEGKAYPVDFAWLEENYITIGRHSVLERESAAARSPRLRGGASAERRSIPAREAGILLCPPTGSAPAVASMIAVNLPACTLCRFWPPGRAFVGCIALGRLGLLRRGKGTDRKTGLGRTR